MKRAVVVACVACWTLAASAPIGAAVTSNADGLAPDQRLDQKVTVKAVGVPLGSFLSNLSATTGVKMTARRDVADDKVAVFVRDMPLGDVEEAIRTVLHLQCSASGKPGAREYEYWMDLKSEQKMRESQQEHMRKLKKQITDYSRDVNLSEDELAEKYADDPSGLCSLQDPTNRGFLGVYALLPSEQCDAMWNGDAPLRIPASELPVAVRDALLTRLNEGEQQMQVQASTFNDASGNEENAPDTYDATTWERVDGVSFKVATAPSSHELTLACTVEGLGTHQPSGFPDAETQTTYSTTVYMSLHEPVSETSEDDELTKALNAAQARTPEEAQAVIGELYGDVRIKLEKSDDMTFFDRLEEIAKKAHLGIVSPYYTCKLNIGVNVYSEDGKGLPADLILHSLSPDSHAGIERRGNLRLVMMGDWSSCRTREIPERMLAGWREVQDKQGYIGLKQLLEMAKLRQEQLGDLHLYGLTADSYVGISYKVLAWVSSLDSAQLSKLMTDEGITAQDLDDAQAALLDDWMEDSHRVEEPMGSPDGNSRDDNGSGNKPAFDSISLEEHVDRSKDGKESRTYMVRVISQDSQAWTPLYTGEGDESGRSRAPVCEITVLSEAASNSHSEDAP